MASPRSTIPKPGRTLAALFVIMAVMTGIMFAQGRSTPKLALDLAGGTTVTLTAVTESGKTPPASQMNQAVSIMRNRVNGLGINGTSLVQQGSQYIDISIPGASATQVRPLLSAAQLRQVTIASQAALAHSARAYILPSAVSGPQIGRVVCSQSQM